MSKTSPSKDKKVDILLLGSAAILIVGLFVFSPSSKKAESHDEQGKAAHENQATAVTSGAKSSESPSLAKKQAHETSQALPEKPVTQNPAKAEKSAPDPKIHALQAHIQEVEKKNAELQSAMKATQGASQEMLASQARAYQARYEDLLKRMNDLTKGLTESLDDHQKEFTKENAK